MNRITDETHAAFQAELIRSDDAVKFVAAWMRLFTDDVVVTGQRVAPTHQVRRDYADKGDLVINGVSWEVKGIRDQYRRYLVDGTDGPNGIAVDPVYKFEAKNPKPLRYVFIDDARTIARFLNVAETRDRWTVASFANHNNPNDHDTYFCRIKLACRPMTPPQEIKRLFR